MPELERQVASYIHLNFVTPVVILMPKADNAASKSMIKMTKSLKKLADKPSYLPTDRCSTLQSITCTIDI